jgi:hypothetical protein
MNTFGEHRPPDSTTVTALSKYSERFEVAVRNGHEVVVAATVQAIVQGLRRFFPEILSKVCAESEVEIVSAPNYLWSPSAPVSPPNAEYLKVVSSAINEFRSALQSGEIEKGIKALYPTGIIRKKDSPREAIACLDLELARSKGVRRLQFLPEAAKWALWSGQDENAEKHATEALRLGRSSSIVAGAEMHDVNMVLGLLALNRGDIETAKMHLRDSVPVEASLEMRMTGVNLSLASALHKNGEREQVVDYLEKIGRLWVSGRKSIEIWVHRIRHGEIPEFDLIHFCV